MQCADTRQDPGATEMNPQSTGKSQTPKRARLDSVSLMQTEDYFCIEPSAPVSKAIEIMKQDEGGCAIVCEGDKVVGIFTERDLLTKIVGQDVDLNTPVSQWMSPIVAILSPSATIGDAVTIMNEKSYRNIPIVDNGKLVGSVSVFDVISYLAETYPKATMNLPPKVNQIMNSTDGG